MSIRRRGKEYHYEFMQSGRRYYGVCEGCTTQRKAQEYEQKVMAEIKDLAAQQSVKALIENRKRELTGGEDILLEGAFDNYLNKPAKRHPGKMRLGVNRRRWMDFVAFMKDKYPDVVRLDQVMRRHAEEYIDYLRTNGRFILEVACGKSDPDKSYVPKRNQLSDKTVNEYHTILKSVFARLASDAGIVSNPFDFEAMKAKTENREVFTMDELTLIDENLVKDPFCRPLFILGANTGLSLEDVCTLEWKNIRSEVQGEFIICERSKTNVRLEIPVLPAVHDLLTELKEKRETLAEDERSIYVLPEHERMYHSSNRAGVSYRINKFLTKLGIVITRETTGARRASIKDFHSLRHTFAYLAGVHHMPLTIVQAILGHMSPEMTRHYQEHASREDKTQFMSHLPALLGEHVLSEGRSALQMHPSSHLLPEAIQEHLDVVSREEGSSLAEGDDVEVLRRKAFELIKEMPADKLRMLVEGLEQANIKNEVENTMTCMST